MKPWRLLLAIAVAVLAIVLLTGLVVAAPSTTVVQIGHVFDSPILTGTMPMTHPVGLAIALYFNIPYTLVMSLHDQGFGFGTIARAYLTAQASQGVLTPEQLLALHGAGVGWGQIKKEYGVHPGGNGLGTIMGNKPGASPRGPAIHVPSKIKPPAPAKPHEHASGCLGNSCSASGQHTTPKGKPTKAPNK